MKQYKNLPDERINRIAAVRAGWRRIEACAWNGREYLNETWRSPTGDTHSWMKNYDQQKPWPNYLDVKNLGFCYLHFIPTFIKLNCKPVLSFQGEGYFCMVRKEYSDGKAHEFFVSDPNPARAFVLAFLEATRKETA